MKSNKQESVDKLVKKLANKNIYEAIEAVSLGASEKMINELIKICISEVCQDFCAYSYFKQAQELAELRGKKLTNSEVAPLINKCLKKGNVCLAHTAAKAVGRDLKKGEIKKLKKKIIKDGNLEGIKYLLSINGEKLSPPEVEQLFENMYYPSWEKVIEVLKLGASQKMIDRLVQKAVAQENFKRALEVAALGASRENIECLIKICLTKGKILTSIEAASLAGRHLSVEEIKQLAEKGCWKYIGKALVSFDLKKASEKEKEKFSQLVDFLIQDCIKYGRLSVIKLIISITGRKLTAAETDRLVGYFICQGKFFEAYNSAQAAGRQLKAAEIDILMNKAIEGLDLFSLKFIAESTGQDLKKEYLEKFIKKAIDNGFWDSDVKEVLKMRGRELTASEVNRLVMQRAKKGDFSFAASIVLKPDNLIKGPPPSQEVIEALISKCIAEGRLSDVISLNKILSRELTGAEIEMLSVKIFN